MSKIKDFFNYIRHHYYELGKVLMFILAMVLVYWQMPKVGKFRYEFQLYKPWQHESLYAPFDFPIYKDAEMLKVEGDEALKSVKPVFQYDLDVTKQARNELETAFDQQWHGHGGMSAETNKAAMMELFDNIEIKGVVAHDKALDGLEPNTMVSLVKNKTASSVTFGSLYTMSTARDAVEQWTKQGHHGVDKKLVSTLILNSIHPNVVYDEAMTKMEQEKALSN